MNAADCWKVYYRVNSSFHFSDHRHILLKINRCKFSRLPAYQCCRSPYHPCGKHHRFPEIFCFWFFLQSLWHRHLFFGGHLRLPAVLFLLFCLPYGISLHFLSSPFLFYAPFMLFSESVYEHSCSQKNCTAGKYHSRLQSGQKSQNCRSCCYNKNKCSQYGKKDFFPKGNRGFFPVFSVTVFKGICCLHFPGRISRLIFILFSELTFFFVDFFLFTAFRNTLFPAVSSFINLFFYVFQMKGILKGSSVYAVPKNDCVSVLVIDFRKDIFCKDAEILPYVPGFSRHTAEIQLFLFHIKIHILRLYKKLSRIHKVFCHFLHCLNKASENQPQILQPHFFRFIHGSHRLLRRNIIINQKVSINSLEPAF